MKCKLDCFHCPYPDCIANGNRCIDTGRSARALARKKEQYEQYKASGICVTCKTNKATHGIRCAACHAEELHRQKERRVQKIIWMQLGLCKYCGGKRWENSEYCYRHMIMHEEYKAADRERKAADRQRKRGKAVETA